MVRESLKTKDSFKSKALGFAIINIFPIGGTIWFAWALKQGKVSLDDLPAGLGRTGIYLALLVALLFVAVTFLLPAFHFFASRLLGQLRRSCQLRLEGGALRQVWEFLLWPFRQVFYWLFWLMRFGMYLVSFALIAGCIVFLVRLAQPDFAEDWLHVNEHLGKFESYIETWGK